MSTQQANILPNYVNIISGERQIDNGNKIDSSSSLLLIRAVNNLADVYMKPVAHPGTVTRTI